MWQCMFCCLTTTFCIWSNIKRILGLRLLISSLPGQALRMPVESQSDVIQKVQCHDGLIKIHVMR